MESDDPFPYCAQKSIDNLMLIGVRSEICQPMQHVPDLLTAESAEGTEIGR